MIEILAADPHDVEAEALVVAVDEALDGITPWSRRALLAGGPEVAGRLARLRGLPPGGAVLTPGGDGPFEFLIPAVLLARDEPLVPALLARAATNALRRAAEWDLSSLVVPALGMGAGQMEGEAVADTLMEALGRWTNEAGEAAPQIRLVVSSQWEEAVFQAALARQTSLRDGSR